MDYGHFESQQFSVLFHKLYIFKFYRFQVKPKIFWRILVVLITRKGKPRLLSFRKVVFKNFPSNLHLITIHCIIVNHFWPKLPIWVFTFSRNGNLLVDWIKRDCWRCMYWFHEKKNQTIILFSREKICIIYIFFNVSGWWHHCSHWRNQIWCQK